MIVQSQARAQLARLRARLGQPANGVWDTITSWVAGTTEGAPAAEGGRVATASVGSTLPEPAAPAGNPSVSQSVKAELAPGAEITPEQLQFLGTWPSAKLRDLAAGQLKRTQDAFTKASGIAWYEGLLIEHINDKRWSRMLHAVEDAERRFQQAETTEDPAKKKEAYIASWSLSRLALRDIANEAELGETGFVYLLGELGRAAQPYLDKAKDVAKETASELKVLAYVGLGLALWQAVRR